MHTYQPGQQWILGAVLVVCEEHGGYYRDNSEDFAESISRNFSCHHIPCPGPLTKLRTLCWGSREQAWRRAVTGQQGRTSWAQTLQISPGESQIQDKDSVGNEERTDRQTEKCAVLSLIVCSCEWGQLGHYGKKHLTMKTQLSLDLGQGWRLCQPYWGSLHSGGRVCCLNLGRPTHPISSISPGNNHHPPKCRIRVCWLG